MEKSIIKIALKVNLKAQNMHLLGLTPLNPYKPKIEKNKLNALLRLINHIQPDHNNYKWIEVPENNFAHYLGIKVKTFPLNNSKSISYKWALPL